jgi:hypothetical protein
MQPGDISYSGWREVYAAGVASDLALHCISPSFAYVNQWTYVEGTDRSYYSNENIHQLYTRSDMAAAAADKVRTARRPLEDTRDQKDFAYHVGEMSAHMYESVAYAQSYLLRSDVSLAITMEHVGFTLASFGRQIKRESRPHPADLELMADKRQGGRILFEAVYAAHCLHVKSGILQGDLHSNNITLHQTRGVFDVDGEKKDDQQAYRRMAPAIRSAYVTGSDAETSTYVFDYNGITCCLIDFSRCIIGPARQASLAAERGERYVANFYSDQVNRVMRLLARFAPKHFPAHQEKLKSLVVGNFEVVFRVLALIDFISIGEAFRAALQLGLTEPASEYDKRKFVVAPEVMALAKRLETEARKLLTLYLLDLVEGTPEARDFPWPGDTLMSLVFAPWKYTAWRDADLAKGPLVEVWNINNALQWSGAGYESYPPWARYENIAKHLGNLKMSDIIERGLEPFQDARRPYRAPSVLSDRIIAEQAALDGGPVVPGSSWAGD